MAKSEKFRIYRNVNQNENVRGETNVDVKSNCNKCQHVPLYNRLSQRVNTRTPADQQHVIDMRYVNVVARFLGFMDDVLEFSTDTLAPIPETDHIERAETQEKIYKRLELI